MIGRLLEDVVVHEAPNPHLGSRPFIFDEAIIEHIAVDFPGLTLEFRRSRTPSLQRPTSDATAFTSVAGEVSVGRLPEFAVYWTDDRDPLLHPFVLGQIVSVRRAVNILGSCDEIFRSELLHQLEFIQYSRLELLFRSEPTPSADPSC